MLEGADHGGSEFWTEQIQQIIIQFFENIKKQKIRQLSCLFLFIESVRYLGLCIYMWLILQAP